MPIEITSKIEWKQLIEEVDKDGDNQIYFNEFKEMMQKLLINYHEEIIKIMIITRNLMIIISLLICI